MAGYLQGLLSELLPTWMRRKATEAGAPQGAPGEPSRAMCATAPREGVSPAGERDTEPPLVGARPGRPASSVADIRRIE